MVTAHSPAMKREEREATARSLSEDDVKILLAVRRFGPIHFFDNIGYMNNGAAEFLNGLGYAGERPDTVRAVHDLGKRGLIDEEILFQKTEEIIFGNTRTDQVLGAWIHLLELDHVSDEAAALAAAHRKADPIILTRHGH